MRADLLRAPSPMPHPSGIQKLDVLRADIEHQQFLAHVQLLADTMLRLALEAKIATWCCIELFPLLQPYHWEAYAREARIPTPSPLVRDAAIALYRRLIQYPADAQPVAQSVPTF